MFKAIASVLAWPLLALVWLYRMAISPWLGNNCRYDPSCSEYALEALKKHGAFRGTWLAARRIGRCHPWGGSGYDPVPDDKEVEQLRKERAVVLNHAYGFISRDNRAGGFKHIHDWIERDPDPDDAWSWFFDQMMLWEVKDPAQLFAQEYLTRLLHDGDHSKAVKVITRCRYVNESFMPLADDRELAHEAAEHCGNEELAATLT
jgi:putative membrane protein insertion efficiency factor